MNDIFEQSHEELTPKKPSPDTFNNSSVSTNIQKIKENEYKQTLADAPKNIQQAMDMEDYDQVISIMIGSPTTLTIKSGQKIRPTIWISVGFSDYLKWILKDKHTIQKKSDEKIDALLTRIDELIVTYTTKIETNISENPDKNPNTIYISSWQIKANNSFSSPLTINEEELTNGLSEKDAEIISPVVKPAKPEITISAWQGNVQKFINFDKLGIASNITWKDLTPLDGTHQQFVDELTTTWYTQWNNAGENIWSEIRNEATKGGTKNISKAWEVGGASWMIATGLALEVIPKWIYISYITEKDILNRLKDVQRSIQKIKAIKDIKEIKDLAKEDFDKDERDNYHPDIRRGKIKEAKQQKKSEIQQLKWDIKSINKEIRQQQKMDKLESNMTFSQ